jgi:hypothetical protein
MVEEGQNGAGRLVVNRTKVAHETIDDEVLIIHTETGAYFSLRGSAAAIWGDILAGGDPALLERRFIGESDEIRRGISGFLSQLVGEEILMRDPSAPAATGAQAQRAEAIPFTMPVLEKFSDMADLLTLDPLHDVDAAGWPYVKDRG